MCKRSLMDDTNELHSDKGKTDARQDALAPPSLIYPDTSRPSTRQTTFQQPAHVLSFSYNSSHQLEFNDSALRYFVGPPRGANLAYGYDRWIWKMETRGRIDALLQAFSKAQDEDSTSFLQNIGVVAWRGVMTRILTAPYEEREGWELNVMLIHDTMYFEEHSSEARLKEKNEMGAKQRLQTYYGYSFESYCTSETLDQVDRPRGPNDPVGWGGDVNTNIQWCSVVRTKLGNTRLVLGGEVDCVRGPNTGQTKSFVELKTSLAIRNSYDESRFERKLLKFYFQSFLLGVPEIIVGFRTPAGVVTTTQSFQTMAIPRLVRGKPHAWDPLVCLEWADRFLSFLNTQLQSHSGHDRANESVYRVKFEPGRGVHVSRLDGAGVEDVMDNEDRVGFLPTWYWKRLHATRSRMERGQEMDTSGVPPGWQL